MSLTAGLRLALALLLVAGCGGGTSDLPPVPPTPGEVDAGLPGVDAAAADLTPPGAEAGADASADLAPPPPDAATAPDAPVPDAAAPDVGGGADNAGPADLPPPRPVSLAFTGAVATVAGTPLGFDGTVRTAPVSGSLTYDLRTLDQRPADPKRGRFEHGASSAFTFKVMGHTIEGSGWAIVQTEDLDPDTFRFIDGPQGDGVPRVMKVDGAPAPKLKLSIAITGGNAFLQGDGLPDPFPTIDIAHTPHTFSLEDDGGTLLMQLDALAPK
ncbi:MAG TPA: hypothetical protein VN914_06220 [Polyangia bacterium]|nr:hypothetical protein [Polyangia bacterium]